jgi:hypothetical protein
MGPFAIKLVYSTYRYANTVRADTGSENLKQHDYTNGRSKDRVATQKWHSLLGVTLEIGRGGLVDQPVSEVVEISKEA